MSSDYTANWLRVKNTVNDRIVDDSLLHTLEEKSKIRRKTKLFNQRLKRYRNLSNYKRFELINKLVSKECPSDDDTDDDLGLTHEDYKMIYNSKPKSELQIVLRSFVKTPQKKSLRKPAVRKSAGTKSKIRKKASSHRSHNKSASKNHKTLVQTTLPPHQLRSRRVTTNNQSNSQAISNDPTSEAPGTFLSTTNNPQFPLDRDTTDQYDLPQVLDARTQLCKETSIEPLISTCTQNEAIDYSEFNSNSESELPDPIEKSMIENLLTTPVDEPQCDVIKALNDTVKIKNEPQDSDDEVPKNCNSSADDLDHKHASSSVSHSRELTETSNSILAKNNSGIKDEIISPEENLPCQIDNDKYTESSSQDSGNNSLSDVDPLIDEDEITPINNDENDRHQYSEIANTVQSKYQLSVLETEVQHEKFVANEKPSEKSAFNDQANNILELSEGCNTNLGVDLTSGIAEDNCKNKVKIRTIERFDKGCGIFNRCQLQEHEQCTSICTSNEKIANDTCKNVDLDESSENQQQSNSSQPHEENSFCSYEINQSNESLSDEDMVFVECVENESGMDVDELLNHNKCSRECVSPEIAFKESDQSCSSINSADYVIKNSLKTQLLQEINERLRESIYLKKDETTQSLSHEMNRSVDGDNLRFSSKKERQDNKVINNCSIIERNQSLELESPRDFDAPITSSQGLIESTNVVDSVETPKSTHTKRRISNCNTDNLPENSKRPRKQACSTQSINKKSELISHERCSLEATSASHSQSENNDDSITTNEKWSKASPRRSKRIPRPRDIQEFLNTEALIPETNKAHFRLKDIKDDDEIWIMEVPKTINPRDLIDQSILLGGKTRFEVENDWYEISSQPSKKIRNISYVFPTSRRQNRYEFVNIESKGHIKFRQKISTTCETELVSSKSEAVPFPKNIKIRHPLFGVARQNVV